jgi:DNA repair exonuclease SbcCD ATPase subunit
VSETLRLILTKFTDETITVFSMLLLVTMAGIIAYWFYNRKKFHQLTHEIPASVVKNYLDSIIQNSTALKSSLFRGGGLDMGNGIPSVVAVGDLPPSMNIGVGSASEEVNQKNAEIASLTLKLNDRTKQISDLEKSPEAELLKKDLAALQAQLAEARAASGGDPNLKQDLSLVTNERNDLRERLKEYEIIEEDLANLKRLQQENDQLKAELAALRRGAPQAKIPEAVPVPVAVAAAPTPVIEEEIDLEAEMARAIEESKPAAKASVVEVPEEAPVVEGEQKSAEELLSEFEKMLG